MASQVLLVVPIIAAAIAAGAVVFLRARTRKGERNLVHAQPATQTTFAPTEPTRTAPSDAFEGEFTAGELAAPPSTDPPKAVPLAAASPSANPPRPVPLATPSPSGEPLAAATPPTVPPTAAPSPAASPPPAPAPATRPSATASNSTGAAARSTATAANSRAAPRPASRAPNLAAGAAAPTSAAGARSTPSTPSATDARPTPSTAPPATAQPLEPPEIFAKLFDLALGKGRAASTVTSGHDDVAAATAAALQDVATQERYAPRRPNMLPRILSAANDESFSGRELAALIARDPSLVGNLLKIANSSYYRVSTEPIESVDRAVVLLGTHGIRSLVTAALMQPIFRIGGADFPRFPEIAWEHTFRSAGASVPYNFLIEKSDPYVAELLSLVMGLAEIVVFRVTIDQYAKNPRLRPDASVVSSLLATQAARVARLIGATWDLSEATLAGLDGQTPTTTTYPTALGRSLYFGRVVGALAVLRMNRVVDDETGKASIPVTDIPEPQIERMWARLTSKSDS